MASLPTSRGITRNAARPPSMAKGSRDPTKTTSIRLRWMGETRRRFRDLKGAIRTWLVVEDQLGLKPVRNARDFEFAEDPEKLAAFNVWLRKQMEDDILSPGPADAFDEPWTAKYVRSSYRRGMVNAHIAAKKAKLLEEGFDLAADQEAFLRDSFNTSEARSKIRLLYGRAFQDLEGITGDMSGSLSRILAQGLADGKGVSSIASEINSRVDGITSKRALVVSRTEVIRAHAEGQLDAYEDLGVKELEAEIEFSTAGDRHVCPICAGLEGKKYTTREARGVIPVHPNCVLGENSVEFGDGLALTRVKYFGPVFRVFTKSGRNLPVTENHILLTQRGWIRAVDLDQTDKLIETSSLDPNLSDLPNDKQGKTSIRNIFEFLLKVLPEGHLGITRARPEDFHGDGRSSDQEIDVILSDCKLRDERNFPGLQEVGKFTFIGGRFFWELDCDRLPRLRSALKLFHSDPSSPYSGMGGEDVSSVLSRATMGHHETVCAGVPAPLDSVDLEDSFNPSSGSPVGFGQLIDRFPGKVSFDEIDRIEIDPTQPGGVDAFDVWTHSLGYSLGGIVSSNCRCTWLPAVGD